jgi:mannan endo-1,4-beta-mannosidase
MSPGRGWMFPALVGVVVALLGAQTVLSARDAPAAKPSRLLLPKGGAVALGVTTRPFAANSFAPWTSHDLAGVDEFERQVGQRTDIVMWFADWEHARFDPRQAAAIARRGSVPEISWEPWDSAVGTNRPQPRYRLATIIAGRHDAYIRSWARGIARYGRPLRLRFAQEMNGTWYPWGERTNGNQQGEFVRAWRHVHEIFTRAGARNVTWVWAPVTAAITDRYYPGTAYTDVVGLSGFNGGTAAFRRHWRSFDEIFGPGLSDLDHLFPGKPIEITEVGATDHGGDKAKWIRGMFKTLTRRQAIRAVVWFNVRKETDWRVSSSRRGLAASVAGAARLRRGRP